MLKSICCALHGKDEQQLTKLGECPLDPGGYFIIKGIEKIVLTQEQIMKNRIFVETDQKGNIQATVYSSTDRIKNRTVIQMENEKFYVICHAFSSKVPVIFVLKAMGMESDQEIVELLGEDRRYRSAIFYSFEDCKRFGVYTQQQALHFLNEKHVKGQPVDGALGVFRRTFLAHVPVHQNNLYLKCLHTLEMMKRLISVHIHDDEKLDKEFLGNKHFVLPGELIALLFGDLFKSMNDELTKRVDKIILKGGRSRDVMSLIKMLTPQRIIGGLEHSFLTGNWDIRQFWLHYKGVTQTLSRLSFIGALSSLTKISNQAARARDGLRALHTSHFGVLCPFDTPQDESIGLVKHLALLAHVTIKAEEGPIKNLCYNLGVENVHRLAPSEITSQASYLVILNGLILGKHRQPQAFATEMRRQRRAGTIDAFVSIFVNMKQRCVYIASDGGRICRPLVIADNGISRIKKHHMEKLKDGYLHLDFFLREGVIEYLDVNEENNALIALHDEEATVDTTHIEMRPPSTLGVCAGLIPYANHNQAPRNSYQCGMGKQAMGNIAHNQLTRTDALMYLLVYPQKPLVTTNTIELVSYDKLGGGQNAIVAVMSFSGYDLEDAIVMNKASLDRGFGRCILMKRMTSAYQQDSVNPWKTVLLQKHEQETFILDNDGLPKPGEIIRNRDIYLEKLFLHPTESRTIKERFKGAEEDPGVVDRVALCSTTDNNFVVKCISRHTRRPEVGDKFSSRHGQKGVCGSIVRQEDMPFSELGICPDIIMNPHGFPSRMTIGNMIELVGSKAAASCGKFLYGTTLGEPSGHASTVEEIGELLVKHKFCYSGKDILYSGTTGSPLESYIFMGPIYYQKLKHMVVDKMHARGMGPRQLITRQPTEGKSRNGGLRVGEMERDCLIAFGASNLIYERLMLSSDPFEAQVCQTCGLQGYINYQTNTRMCSSCKNGDNMASVKLPYACKLLLQELQSMNIVVRLNLDESS